MASEIRVDKINSLSGVGTVTLSPTGVDIAGITTAATLRATTGIVTSLTAVSSAKVGSGVTLSPDGDIFATGVTTSTTFVGALTGNVTGNATGLSGTPNISAGTIAGSTGTFTGTVAVDGGNITLGDNDEVRLGDSGDLQLFHNSSTGEGRIFNSNAAGINIITDLINIKNNANNETMFKATNGGAVELYHNNIKKLQTSTTDGVIIGNTTDDANYTNALTLTRRGYENSGYGVRIQAKGGSIASQNGLRIKISDGGGSNYTSRFSFTNDGLLFNSDTAATNALDDYEEGSWVPTIGGNNMSVNHAHYTKIGQFVHLDFDITGNASANGNTIAGLPFPAVEYSAFHFGWVSDSNGSSQNTTALQGGLLSSAGFTMRTAGGNVNMNVASGQRVIGCAQYRTAS